MDQGLAAILGAGVGIVGSVVTSALSGWSARQQLQRQAQLEHAHWRRQARRDAYSAFLDPASQARTAMKLAGRSLIGERNETEADQSLAAAQSHLAALRSAWASLEVEGPELVAQISGKVHTSLASMHNTLVAWRACPDGADRNVEFVEQHALELTTASERIAAFTFAARAALDEDFHGE